MAADRGMIDDFQAGRIPPTLRLYGWKRPAFTVGRFQNSAQILDLESCEKQGVDVVGRPTGGAVLFHQFDATYSVVCAPEDLGRALSVNESYFRICSLVVTGLRRLGLDPRFAGDAGGNDSRRTGFCLASREHHDVLLNGRKIGGNAQRRMKGLVFQHGSIPLRLERARAARFLRNPQDWEPGNATSLEEEMGRFVQYEEISSLLLASFRDTFGV